MKNNENINDVRRIGITEEEINSPDFDPEEFAPAPDKKGNSSKNDGTKHSSVLFAVMCTVFAVIIAVFGILAPVENTHKIEAVREQTVLSQFKYCTEAKFAKKADGCDVYAVYYKKKLAGIGIYHTVKGFAGDIEMLLIMGGKNEIVKVMIVDENESASLGDKIRDEKFLKQFNGMTVFGENTEVDLISCATISSNAVAGGVKDILETGINTFSVAKDLKLDTITADEIKADKKNIVDEEEETTGDPEETTGSGKITHKDGYFMPDMDDSDGRKLNGKGGGANGNNGDGDMNVDGKDVTTVYETETKETETADTTKAANKSSNNQSGKDKYEDTKSSDPVKPKDNEDTTAKPAQKPAQETKPVPVTTAAPETEPPATEPPVTEPPVPESSPAESSEPATPSEDNPDDN